jgi:3-oxoacyl-[acyl-carrier protein] reductase
MINLLDDKLALITGASGGIGGAIAKAMYRAGATVVATGRSHEKLTNLESEILDEKELARGTPYFRQNNIYTIPTNLMDPAELDTLVKRVQNISGKTVDILVNAAGIHQLKSFRKISKDILYNVLNMNFTVPLKLCQDVLDSMVKQGFGRIINITSVATHGAPGQAHYNSSKAALNGLTKSLASNPNFVQNGVTINAIAPGVIETSMSNSIMRGKIKDQNLAMIPMGRFGKPDEVAGAAVFLASDAASYINAQILHVDGGMAR